MTGTRLEVVADLSRCCGSGQCARTVPRVFDQRPADGRVHVLDPSPPVELLGKLEEAQDLCPVRAIRVIVHGPVPPAPDYAAARPPLRPAP